jgi:hypothetical protein
MNLIIKRRPIKGKPTLGELWIDGEFFCFTLEDEDRGLTDTMTINQIQMHKVYGETAIPYGDYRVQITASPKFGRFLPLVLNVRGFEGIRFHKGNVKADTLGCVLVGFNKTNSFSLLDSDKAEKALVKKFQDEGIKNTHNLIITKA